MRELRTLIESGHFEEALSLVRGRDLHKLTNDELFPAAYRSKSICYYGSLLHALDHFEPAEVHYCAAIILVSALNIYEGGYFMAYHHISRAMKLDEGNLDYKMFSLILNSVPEKPMPDEEAIELSKQIVSRVEGYEASGAREVLDRLNVDY